MPPADAGAIRLLGLDAVADEVAVKTRAAYVGPEMEYANWGKNPQSDPFRARLLSGDLG